MSFSWFFKVFEDEVGVLECNDGVVYILKIWGLDLFFGFLFLMFCVFLFVVFDDFV